MAGGGVKPGFAYGETDEWGYKVVKDKLEMHDLHATILHRSASTNKRQTYPSADATCASPTFTGRSSGRSWRDAVLQAGALLSLRKAGRRESHAAHDRRRLPPSRPGLALRPVEIEPEALADAVRGHAAMGFRGGNVTTPHKVAIVKHLDRIAESASLMGAVTASCAAGTNSLGRIRTARASCSRSA